MTIPLMQKNTRYPVSNKQGGASLILVMIILTIVSMIGIAGIQISTMSERGARNDRDYQIAWQSAEAALADAENEFSGPIASSRRNVFSSDVNLAAFFDGCGTTLNSQGLCTLNLAGKPVWAIVDFENQSGTAPTAFYGQFTGRTFTAGGVGIQPNRNPRYVIEAIKDNAGRGSSCRNLGAENCSYYVYRVTSMGFGPRADIQAVVQMLYRN